MNVMQERMHANLERMEAKMDSNQKEMKANQAITAELRVWQKKIEVMEAYPERVEARAKTNQEPVEAEIKTGLFEVETTDLEANPKEKEIVEEQHGVPNEEATVKTIGALVN
jgi:isopentenyldiphosphate isomerase